MSRRVRILRRAQADLVSVQAYLAREAPTAAERLVEALLSAMDGLAEHPMMGALPRDARLRRLGFRVLPCAQYLIFYKTSRSVVRVYRVLHMRRAYERLR